ncbi:MAG: iron-sulfur cluster assembly scaffold protein [Thermoplasmata archaeon]|nr:iron-sulfur cluster assembly scaffold protein [Thermoplasmata archaeon]
MSDEEDNEETAAANSDAILSWENISIAVLEESQSPSDMRSMTDASGWSRFTGPCGDTMEVYLKLAGEKITDAAFLTNGCMFTIACGSVLTRLAKGRTLETALAIKPGDIEQALGGLPEEHRHCARLAVATLRMAMRDYITKRLAAENIRKFYILN